MAKFSDLPPEIAEQIVHWVEHINSEHVEEEADALMDMFQAGGMDPDAVHPNPPGPAPAPAPAHANRANGPPGGNVPAGNNPFAALFNMLGGPPGQQAQNNINAPGRRNNAVNRQPAPPAAPQHPQNNANNAPPLNPFAAMFAPAGQPHPNPNPHFTFSSPLQQQNNTGPAPSSSSGPRAAPVEDSSSEEEDMPPLEVMTANQPAPAASTSAASQPAAASTSQKPWVPSLSKKGKAPASDSEDEMPPLEPLNPINRGGSSGSQGKAKATEPISQDATAASTSKPSENKGSGLSFVETLKNAFANKAAVEKNKKKTSGQTPQPSASTSSQTPPKAPPVKTPKGISDSDQDGPPPLEPLAPNQSSSTLSATEPARQQRTRKDGPPPLEPMTPEGSPKITAKTSKIASNVSSDDDMPDLEPLNPASRSMPRPKATSSKSKRSSACKEDDDDSDEMPPLEPLTPKPNHVNLKPSQKASVHDPGSDSDASMPALEPLGPTKPSSSATGSRRSVKDPSPPTSDSDNDIPPLEPLYPHASRANPSSSRNKTNKTKPAAKEVNTSSDEDDDLPPLEPIHIQQRGSQMTSQGISKSAAKRKRQKVNQQQKHLDLEEHIEQEAADVKAEAVPEASSSKAKEPESNPPKSAEPPSKPSSTSQKGKQKDPVVVRLADLQSKKPDAEQHSSSEPSSDDEANKPASFKTPSKGAPSRPAAQPKGMQKKVVKVEESSGSSDDDMPAAEPIDPSNPTVLRAVPVTTQRIPPLPTLAPEQPVAEEKKEPDTKLSPAVLSSETKMDNLTPSSEDKKALHIGAQSDASSQNDTTSKTSPDPVSVSLDVGHTSSGTKGSVNQSSSSKPLADAPVSSTSAAVNVMGLNDVKAHQKEKQREPSDDDDGPPVLTPIDETVRKQSGEHQLPPQKSKTTPPTSAKKPSASAGGGGGFFANFGAQVKNKGGMFGSGTKKTGIDSAKLAASKTPLQKAASAPPPPADPGSDTDMPPLEPLGDQKTSAHESTSPGTTNAATSQGATTSSKKAGKMPEKSFQGQSVSKSKPGASEEDGLPAIEKLQRMSSGGSKDQGIKKKASSSKSPAEHTDSDDSMPALESIKVETPAPPIASTSISAKKGSGPPPLEPITSSDEEEDSNNDSISENERPRTHPPPLDPMALSEDEMDLLFRVAIEDEFPEADEDMDDDSEGSYDETLDESDEEDEWETEDEDTAGEIENRWVPSEADWTVDPSTWSFPDGLPADCMLPLALVNRPFLYAARKILYTKGINVNSPWQLHLLVRTLASAQVSPFMDDPASTAASGTINSMVKHLSFHIACGTGPASLGRGGIGLVAEAIQHCPRATNVTIKSDPLRSAWPVLEKALRTARHLETISLRSGSDQTHPMLLSTDRLASLTQYWPDLKQINLLALARPTDLTLPLSASAIHRQLTTVSLTSPNITGKELGMMLAASVGQLHSFKLIDPSNEMTRGDLAEVLLTHAPYITELALNVHDDWHPRLRTAPASGSPEISAYFLNCIVSKLQKLETLSFMGPLANSNVFTLMPSSLVKLSWGQCRAVQPIKVAGFLSTPNRSGKQRLPKLNCVTVIEDDTQWQLQDLEAVETQLRLRGCCFHNTPSTTLGGILGMGPLPLGPVF